MALFHWYLFSSSASFFLYCFGHDLKLYYRLSSCTYAIAWLPHRTMCSLWWDFVLFICVSHCLNRSLVTGRCSEMQSDLSMKDCVLSLSSCVILVWQGEICLCTSRIFVQRSIYEEFLEKFVEATRRWKVGIPSDPLASMGALISKAHLEKVSKSLQ